MMTVEFTPDDGRRVYTVPVKLLLECTFHVLAHDTADALRRVNSVDLEDYFAFDQSSIHMDADNLLRINDVRAHPIIVSIVDLTQLTTDEYPPNEHPDFVGVRR